jgi:folate-dependent phosphoribosylglycinamide formyltransferase PurN
MSNIRLAIFASGSGSTGEKLFPYTKVVITNRIDAGIKDRVDSYNKNPANTRIEFVELPRIKVEHPDKKESFRLTQQKYGAQLLEVLKKYEVEFISQNGWDILTPKNVVELFKDRIVNSHPGPLPEFGGKFMEGLVVHAAVLKYWELIGFDIKFTTLINLHKVTENYDEGKVLAATKVALKRGDTPESLEERVKENERNLLQKFWGAVAKNNRFPKRSPVHLPTYTDYDLEKLEQAKRFALEHYG